MDTLNPSVQDELTGFKGSFVSVEKAIASLKKYEYGKQDHCQFIPV